MKDTGDYQVKRSQPMNTKMLVVNSGKKDNAVSDKTVRQAIGHMVNRDKIAKEILDGQEKPATQLFAKNVTDINFDMPTRKYDLKKAESLLDEAGWKKGKDSDVRQKMVKTLKWQCTMTKVLQVKKNKQNTYKQNLRKWVLS
ncbi:ABC transporter substrate-binding protein [Staphylococcus aureus]|nr:ABC transporter substrate-binding protein [Staphylococcus aureus]